MPGLVDIGKRAGQALGARFFTAKGDTFAASASGVAGVLTVPTDGKARVADSSQTYGWGSSYFGTVLAGAGQQSSVTIDNTEKSILDSTLTIPVRCTTGDLLRIEFVVAVTQNSGGARTWTPKLKFGGSAVHTGSMASMAASASVRYWHGLYLLRFTSTSSQRIFAEHNFNLWGNGSQLDIGTASTGFSSAVTLDLSVTSNAATATQSAQVDQLTVAHLPLKTV